MIRIFIPIRNVQNGDHIRLVRKPYYSMNGYTEDAYNDFEGIVSDVDPLVDNSFVLTNEHAVCVCPGCNYRGYTPGQVYIMDGKKYRCQKTQEIPYTFKS